MSGRLLDEEQFRRCCQLLLQQSEKLRDGWRWEAVQDSEEGYLRKTAVRLIPADWALQGPEGCRDDRLEAQEPKGCRDDRLEAQEPKGCRDDRLEAQEPETEQAGSLKEKDDDDDDDVCQMKEGSILQYDYHVLFSCSYAVPVLYFRVSTPEGRSLSLEEVWSSIHPNFRLHLRGRLLTAVSQQEHPVLGQPFFFLHPCRTEEFMRPVVEAAEDHGRPVNYVLSWLSVVGPVVGLDLPLQYSTQLHPVASPSSSVEAD